ncbi:DUF1847 domain-containing protein [bacterium]|nr:DUF1847 domain-containing protein [bacterium]
MRLGIPLLSDRIAPRCTFADHLVTVNLVRDRLLEQDSIRLPHNAGTDFVRILRNHHVDVLICGGISRNMRKSAEGEQIKIIANITGTLKDVFQQINAGKLPIRVEIQENKEPLANVLQDDATREVESLNCLSCMDRICLRGKSCIHVKQPPVMQNEHRRIIESTLDISFEKERKLCRITELIYFCLEMGYKKIGLAFCVDLLEPTEILFQVLRRFFKVYPVCCKVGGKLEEELIDLALEGHLQVTSENIACNPLLQAKILNQIGTDINVATGLCVGSDLLFNCYSDAPVSTLFVKDKSLANNPIGAVYSEYYIKEAEEVMQSLLW